MTQTPSLAMRLTKLFFRLRGNSLNAKRLPAWRRKIEQRDYPPHAPLPVDFNRRFRVEEEQIDGQSVYMLAPRQARHAIHMLYTHGGAYVWPLNRLHWNLIGKLIERLGVSITVPIFPLAPEHTYQAAFAGLETVYREIARHYADEAIILSGDSAGGGLALAQALHYRGLGLRLPDRIILFSPWLDITMTNPEAAAIEPRDVILGIPGLVQCGKWWAGGDDLRSPLLSPLYGDLSGLPPIDVFAGTDELFLPDARMLHRKVSEAGGTVNLYEYPGAIHVFVGATFTPESRDAFRKLEASLIRVGDPAESASKIYPTISSPLTREE